jgi:single-strand DNA-binding protein
MVNLSVILGRVGRIETKTLANDMKVTNMSVVTTKKFVKDGEKIEKATWHNISLYSKLSDIAEKYVAVGHMIYIQGEMDNQKYISNDGTEKVRFQIIAHELKLLPNPKKEGIEGTPSPQESFALNDDIPF